MKTQYLVLPYKLGARGKIAAEQAQACKTEGEARRTAERLSRRYVGVVAIAQNYDDSVDHASDPVVLATFGTVPDQWEEFKVAEAA